MSDETGTTKRAGKKGIRRRWAESTAGRRLSALLRPRPERRLPKELRARHIGELVRNLEGGIDDPRFLPLLQGVDDDGILHTGNLLVPFFDGFEALASMLAAIAAAQEEVLVEAYIFHDDETGWRFLKALSQAAERGATVRVLADAYGSFSTRRRFWQTMRQHGIEVRLFHPLFPTFWWQPFRDHRKIVVVDRHTAFTGGMNIADEYGSARRPRHERWRDTHLRLEGPAAREMAAVFSEGWEKAGGEPLVASAEPVLEPGDSRVMVLESIPGRGHRETAAVLAAILAAARRTVWITNAYFAPNRVALRLLVATARRGVDVRLLLPGRTDVPIVRHAGHGNFARLLAAGVRIFEYQPAVLHAKTVVADGRIAVVGSSNLDLRSFRYNAECNLVLPGPELATLLEEQFRRDLEVSAEITAEAWNQRSAWHKLGDRLARKLSPLL